MATADQLFDLADALATVAHSGQVRKGPEAEPYVNHVRRVSFRVHGTRAKTIALLHDVIEDTDVSEGALRRIGFPKDIVTDVLALTRNAYPMPDPPHLREETYREFIERTIRDGSDDALLVKLADLQDNLNDPWVTKTKLAERYLPAVEAIKTEQARRAAA